MDVMVSSGGYSAIVKIRSIRELVRAFRLFIEQANPRQLGEIASISGPELDDTYYLSTRRALKTLGRSADDPRGGTGRDE